MEYAVPTTKQRAPSRYRNSGTSGLLNMACSLGLLRVFCRDNWMDARPIRQISSYKAVRLDYDERHYAKLFAVETVFFQVQFIIYVFLNGWRQTIIQVSRRHKSGDQTTHLCFNAVCWGFQRIKQPSQVFNLICQRPCYCYCAVVLSGKRLWPNNAHAAAYALAIHSVHKWNATIDART